MEWLWPPKLNPVEEEEDDDDAAGSNTCVKLGTLATCCAAAEDLKNLKGELDLGLLEEDEEEEEAIAKLYLDQSRGKLSSETTD